MLSEELWKIKSARSSRLQGEAEGDADTDALPDIAKKYDAKVLPTFLMWKNGSEVARVQGYKKALLSEAVASLAK